MHLAHGDGLRDDRALPVPLGEGVQLRQRGARAHIVAVLHAGIVRHGRNEGIGVEGVHPARDVHQILHDVVGSRVAPRALTEEALHAHTLALHADEVEIRGHGGLERIAAEQRRLDVGADAAAALFGGGDQLARAVVRLKACDVRLAHVADAEHRHVRLAQRYAKGHVGGQDQLALDVQPVDVSRGVGLGVAERLRLREYVGKIDVAAVHGVHDVVRRAVEDAPDAGDVVGARGLFEVCQPRDAAADRRRAPQRRAVLPGERVELVIVAAHEVFVRGHHVLSGAQRSRHVLIRRVQTAHDLHDGVHRGVAENVLDIICGLGSQLAEIAPAQHPRCADIVPVGEHIVNAPADNAKTKKSDVHDVPSL